MSKSHTAVDRPYSSASVEDSDGNGCARIAHATKAPASMRSHPVYERSEAWSASTAIHGAVALDVSSSPVIDEKAHWSSALADFE